MSGLAMAGVFAAIASVAVAAELIASDGAWATFSPYGLNSLVASLAFSAGVVLAFSHRDRTQGTARRLILVFGLMAALGVGERLAYHALGVERPAHHGWTLAASLQTAVWLLSYVWLIGAARQAFRPAPVFRRPGLRAVAFLVVLVVTALLPPGWPVFAPKTFDRASANLWEYGRTIYYAKRQAEQATAVRTQQAAAEAQAARLEAAQGALLTGALDKLAARDPGRANVFTLGVAGWGYQDVFLKEIRQATDILKSHFQWGERTLTLVNNEAVAQEAPMASIPNLADALRALGKRMNRDEDLLVLVLSSHGSPDGFALSYDNLVERALDPETLRSMLDGAGIKNRVIVVSSCYSGTFVAPLQNPDTMILTAASADRTSFGCADDRRWTWFGEALFEKGLAERATLADAFSMARTTIAAWEGEKKLPASQPQIFVGAEIARKFPDIVGAPPPQTHAAIGATASSQAE